MALSDVQIRKAKPRAKPYKLSDGGWLYLVVAPSGSKLWRMAYRFAGRERLLSLGAYPQLSLKDTRTKRDEAKALLAAGIDPGQARRQEKIANATTTAATFQALADEYLDRLKREGKAPATLAKVTWLLSIVLPKLGARPIVQITAAEVLGVLKPIEARGNLETVKRARSTIGAIFRYAIATARCDSDPTTALKGALMAPRVTHRAAILDPVALGGFLRAVDAYKGQPSTMAALQLLPLVFTRPSELRMAAWAEFDLDRALWAVPASRTKMRREHVVPLARQTLAVLKRLQTITGNGRLLFPGLRSVERPISENTVNVAMRAMGYGQDDVCGHGFRATASTLLNESGKFSVDAIERALAHQDINAVRRAYARGEHMKERVDMMQWWADNLDKLRSGGEVIELPMRKA